MKKSILNVVIVFGGVLNAQVNLTSSLTACYDFNGTANDAISALNGTLNSVSPTTDRFNNANSALYFAGNPSSFVELPNNPGLKPINAISISSWVNPASLNQNMTFIFTKNTSSSFFTGYSVNLEYSAGGYKFRGCRQNGSGSDIATGTTNAAVNTWYHVVLCIDASTMKLYVNGVLESSIANSIPAFSYDPAKGVIVGGENESFNQPFPGSVDNLRFYSRVINAAEVSALYNQDPPCSASGAVPVAYFSTSSVKVCAGGAVTFTDQSQNNPTSWNWSVPGAVSSNSNLNIATFTFVTPGNYVASLTASNSSGMSTNTATQSIAVLANPTVTAVPNKTIYCLHETMVLTGAGATTYTWNGVAGTGAVYNFPGSSTLGNITITVTGTDANGCKGVGTLKVNVVSDCVGLMENQSDYFSAEVFPNPSHGVFTLRSSVAIAGIQLLHISGKICLENQEHVGNELTLDIQKLPSGIYVLKALTDSGNKIFRIIKE